MMKHIYYALFVCLVFACKSDDSNFEDLQKLAKEKPIEISVPTSFNIEEETIPTAIFDTTYNDYIEHLDPKASIEIVFNGNDATVSGTTSYTKDGAHVVVTTSRRTEILVSGNSDNASLKILPSVPLNKDLQFRCAVILNNANLSNPQGAVINSQLKKRLLVHSNDGTKNVLSSKAPQTDEAVPDPAVYGKGCIFSEDNIIFSGKGSLQIKSSFRNCVAADDKVVIRPNTFITLYPSAGNGIKANDGVFVKGGQTTIFSTATTELHKVPVSDLYPQGIDTVNCAGVKTDYSVFVNNGLLQIKCEGNSTKGIKADFDYVQDGGDVRIVTLGQKIESSPKAIKTNRNVNITAGKFYGYSKTSQAIEADGTCNISSSKQDKGYLLKVGY